MTTQGKPNTRKRPDKAQPVKLSAEEAAQYVLKKNAELYRRLA